MSFTDENIYTYCSDHATDIQCKCLHPDPTIEKIGHDLRLPYYCWYAPCKRKDALIPAALRANISRCNVTDCTITLGDINLNNGVMKVRNTCMGDFYRSVNVIKYLNHDPLPAILPPNILIFLFAIISILILL